MFPAVYFFMYQKTATILPLQMNHNLPPPTQILQYLQWHENKDPLDPKPNNILEKKVRAEI